MSEIFLKLRIKEILTGKMRRYLIFGIVEIFLVVAGILIALTINNWNVKKTQRNDELKIYQTLRERIEEDKEVILDDIAYNQTYLAQYQTADRIISENRRSAQDTLIQIVPNMLKYSDFDKSSYIYQNLVNSGELKLLENSQITSGLQALEESYIYLNRMEDIHLQFIIEIVGKDVLNSMDFSATKSTSPDVLYSYQFHNRIYMLIAIMEEKDEVYRRTIQQIDQLSEMLESEINS